MRLLIILLLICPSAFAGYTTMTIEGVKQANGLWTAAGVIDSMGFVKSTGAVSVLGTTRNLPVSMTADLVASSALVKGAARLAGPAALGLAAYDIYQYITTETSVVACGNDWCVGDLQLDLPTVPVSCKLASSGQYSGYNTTAQNCIATNINYWNAYGDRTTTLNGMNDPVTSGSGYKYAFTLKSVFKSGAIAYYSYDYYTATKPPVTHSGTRATDLDWSNIGPLPISILISGFANLPALKGKPIPINGTSFTPFSEWYGEPYFKDGQWWRDRIDVSPAGTKTSPTRVNVDIGPVKLDGQTDPNTVPQTGTATGSTPKEPTDFCKKNPQSIACQELGELKPDEFIPVEKPFNITPQNPWGSGDAQCPAPKVMHLTTGSTVTLSYQPACDFFRGVRPAVLALALLAALYIALGIPVGKGD